MPEYTVEEVEQHNLEGDRWLIFDGKVYDVSEFKHPGGKEAIEKNGGLDVTEKMFEVETHQKYLENVQKYLTQLEIGTLKK